MNPIYHRTSVRKFKTEPVGKALVTKLLRAAMAAPSAGNQQPWEFCVVTDTRLNEQLSHCSPYAGPAAKAPLVIVPCGKAGETRFPEYTDIDLAIASEHILLEADRLGLGAVWLGIAPIQERIDKVRQVLGLKEPKPFALLAIGYPAESRLPQDRFDAGRIHLYP